MRLFLVDIVLRRAQNYLPLFNEAINNANLRGQQKPTVELYEPTSVGASISSPLDKDARRATDDESDDDYEEDEGEDSDQNDDEDANDTDE